MAPLFAQSSDIKPFAKDAVEKGWGYFQRGDLETALKRFHQATIIDPGFAPGYFGKAYVYSVQSKFKPAIEMYKKTIDLEKGFAPAYYNIGLALISSGKKSEALPYLKKALKLAPNDPDAHVNMAVYYFESKEYKKSWEQVHLAQRLNGSVKDGLLHDLEAKMPEPKE